MRLRAIFLNLPLIVFLVIGFTPSCVEDDDLEDDNTNNPIPEVDR